VFTRTLNGFGQWSDKILLTRIGKKKTINFEQACVLNRHVCVLNRHAVRQGNNATQSVDLTRIRVIVFLNIRSYVPAT
jgi:sensor histidine kinase regulating citrate/malate metabolism